MARLSVLGARENNSRISTLFFHSRDDSCDCVSGSGKSTLVNDILYRAGRQLYRSARNRRHKSITGSELIDKVIRIDQSPIVARRAPSGDLYRNLRGGSRPLRHAAESASAGTTGRFSSTSPRALRSLPGEGQRRIEMNFLPDVYVQCEVCGGRRYNHETLSVLQRQLHCRPVEMPVSDALQILETFRSQQKLQTLVDVAGYIIWVNPP